MIHRQDHDEVAVLRLEHGKANALDPEVLDAVETSLDELAADSARAVVLTGAGGIFSAGVDLKRALAGGPDYLGSFVPKIGAAVLRLATLPKPVIAALNGHAIAGGLVLASACDRRILAAGKAKVGVTELLVGVPFPWMALEAVRRVAPPGLVSDLVLSGRLVGAEEALRCGLVDEVVEPERLLDRAIEVAREFARVPADTFRATKERLWAPVFDRREREEAACDAEVVRIWTSPETQQAIRRFVEATLGGSTG